MFREECQQAVHQAEQRARVDIQRPGNVRAVRGRCRGQSDHHLQLHQQRRRTQPGDSHDQSSTR